MGRTVILLVLLMAMAGTAPGVNLLTGHEFAVDSLYRAETRGCFRGEMRRIEWNDSRNGLVLMPSTDRTCVRGDFVHGAHALGTYYSQPIRCDFEFHEICPSWNIDLDEEKDGYRVFVRVADAHRHWSPWFYLGGGGICLDGEQPRKILKSSAWGLVDIDYMLLNRPARYLQYKVSLESLRKSRDLRQNGPALVRFTLAYSNTGGNRKLWEEHKLTLETVPDGWMTTLSVPYRSQLWVHDRRLRGQICCPTCVAMVLESLGTDLPTTVVAAQCYDREYRIYGTWPRASQAASRSGMEAWVQRFRSDDDVKRMIARGVPVVASIRADKGELTNSTYSEIAGHLIVLIGFTGNGDYIVNDPYAQGDGAGQRVYTKEDIAKVWFNKGGVGIVIRKPVGKGDN